MGLLKLSFFQVLSIRFLYPLHVGLHNLASNNVILDNNSQIKGRRRRLRPKAQIIDDPLDNPYDGLKVLFGPPYV